MMKQLSDADLDLVRKGDNQPLTQIFVRCYDQTLRNVMAVMQCSKADAEDVLMDSIIVLRDAIVDENYRNENVGAYLSTVAINRLRNKNKKDYRMQFVDEEELITKTNSGYSMVDQLETKVDQIITSISQLTGKCKSLLQRNLIEGVSLSVLVSELDYSSYDVAKTSKSRCMAKLRDLMKEQN